MTSRPASESDASEGQGICAGAWRPLLCCCCLWFAPTASSIAWFDMARLLPGSSLELMEHSPIKPRLILTAKVVQCGGCHTLVLL